MPDLSPFVLLGILSALLLVVLAIGTRVAIALALAGIVGLMFFLDPAQPLVLGRQMWHATNNYTLTAVPLFVLMAELLVRTGISGRAYTVALQWLGSIRGGAAYAAVLGSAVFAAMSGSSVANAAAMGTIAGKQMAQIGYSHRLNFGTIAAGGTLGILIPPSTALIVYGALTNESIAQLFMAGVIPGAIGMVLFIAVVAIWTRIRPEDAPPMAPVPMRERLLSLGAVFPALVLLFVVLGGIYWGIFSPTEAAGIGAFCAAGIGIAQRTLTVEIVRSSLRATVNVTAMIMFIIAAATVVTYVVGFLQIPAILSQKVVNSGLPVLAVLLLVGVLFIVLGCFVESVSLIVLTIPVLYPVMISLGVSGIWFGIFMVILVEIALIHPPVGLNLFVLQKIPAGQSFKDIAIGAMPYLFALFLLLGFMIAYPTLATWLPQTMMVRQ